jgi:excinuclease ABC subunit A
VANGKGPTQEVVLTCHALDDLETPGFDGFLARAVASYQRLGKTGTLMLASDLSSMDS